MIHNPTKLALGHLELKEITDADTPFVIELRNHPAVEPWFFSTQKITTESHTQFLQKYFDPTNTDEVYVIHLDSKPVGMISLYNITKNEAEWGRVVIHPDVQHQGLGRQALTLLIQRASDLQLHRLHCVVVKTNTRAVSLYTQLGFSLYQEDEQKYFYELEL